MEAALAKATPGIRKQIRRHAREWGMLGHEKDMEQEALIAVMHSIERGESAEVHGVHAYRAIHRYARKQWRHTNRRDELDALTLVEVRPYDDPVARYEAKEAINALLDLPPREREILIREGFGQTQDEIAEGVHLTRQRVGQLRDRAIHWLTPVAAA